MGLSGPGPQGMLPGFVSGTCLRWPRLSTQAGGWCCSHLWAYPSPPTLPSCPLECTPPASSLLQAGGNGERR